MIINIIIIIINIIIIIIIINTYIIINGMTNILIFIIINKPQET